MTQMAATARVLLLTPLLCFGVARGQDLGSLEWFRAEWQKAERWTPPENVAADFTVSRFELYSPKEIAEFRELADRKPDHPARLQLLAQQQFQESGGQEFHYQLWYGSEARWRLSRDNTRGPEGYFDMGRAGSDVWGLSPTELSMLDSEIPAPDGYQYGRTGLDEIRLYLAVFLCPLSIDVTRGLRPTASRVQGDLWQGRAESPDGTLAVEYEGLVDQENGRVDLLRRKTVRDVRNPDNTGVSSEFGDWIDVLDGSGRAVTWRRQLRADGSVIAEYALARMDVLSRATLNKVISAPSRGGKDFLRGTVAVKVVNDFRPDHAVTTVYRDGQVVRQAPLPQQRLVPARPSRWRAIGWAVAGLVLFGLVALRLRRATVCR